MLNPNIHRFRLGLFNPCAESPYGFQRLFCGFGAMRREDPRFEIVLPPPNCDPASYGQALVNLFLLQIDALLIVNPNHASLLNLMRLARKLGVPVWLDWGDNIFAVRPSNPAEASFMDTDAMRQTVTAMLQESDLATVATETMRAAWPVSERLTVLGDECRVPRSERPRRKFISWRGMSSHSEDIETVLPQWARLVADPLLKDWSYVLFGDPPWKLVETLALAAGEDYKKVKAGAGERILVSPFLETVTHFYHTWTAMAPYLHVVPLADNEFNRGKSANAWLECAGIGAAVICPDHLPEWQQPGIITYSNSPFASQTGRDFESVLRREIVRWEKAPWERAKIETGKAETETDKPDEERGKFHPAVAPMRAAVYPKLTTAALNVKRWAILRKLADLAESAAKKGKDHATIH